MPLSVLEDLSPEQQKLSAFLFCCCCGAEDQTRGLEHSRPLYYCWKKQTSTPVPLEFNSQQHSQTSETVLDSWTQKCHSPLCLRCRSEGDPEIPRINSKGPNLKSNGKGDFWADQDQVNSLVRLSSLSICRHPDGPVPFLRTAMQMSSSRTETLSKQGAV
jgi:hypothetical protein